MATATLPTLGATVSFAKAESSALALNGASVALNTVTSGASLAHTPYYSSSNVTPSYITRSTSWDLFFLTDLSTPGWA